MAHHANLTALAEIFEDAVVGDDLSNHDFSGKCSDFDYRK
jgi:hypothetical protein